ncbi:MAG: hypothetical protein EA401_01605 [Planctomycetota bacterium]|nr:MAG: hypothetical protein EA401_01605 [Planctomycetota bacterium]
MDAVLIDSLVKKFDAAVAALAAAPAFAKPGKLAPVFDLARRLMLQEGGCALLRQRAKAFEDAGVFTDSDWEHPHTLVPSLTAQAWRSPSADLVVVEALSELRILAIAMGDYASPRISAEAAQHFLSQALSVNLSLLFSAPSEAERVTQGRLALVPWALLRYIAEEIGYHQVIDQLITEIWRLLDQRPVQVDSIKTMVVQVAVCQNNPEIDLSACGQGADRLVSSLFGPTQATREDPGVDVYAERLGALDQQALANEASGFARSMHDTGLVSPYHAVFLRFLLESKDDRLLAEALGLSSTGRDCLLCYNQLIHDIIAEAVYPDTAQAIYGLALFLERGVLYQPPLAPSLWRQLRLPLSPAAESILIQSFGDAIAPRARLLAGALSLLGLPLGVGQGNNPTCQAARALSMWAYNDPDYLLQMIAWAARDDEIILPFEGEAISSRQEGSGVATAPLVDLDPVSLLVVPHLDRIYAAMGRRCVGREGDPHRWVNPEFHGWWNGRGFAINVDVATGKLHELEAFVRLFYASFHPYYNGNQPLIHPQPAGIAVTDSAARFVGWHAITILRVALDQEDIMRLYFFNPNNDSSQNWGAEVMVGTAGHGERFGESSLPFWQFASRLYIFHYDPLEHSDPSAVDAEEVARVRAAVEQSWGADRLPQDTLQAAPATEH